MSTGGPDYAAALAALQQALWALAEGLPEPVLRGRYHPQLSPLGWHLGHCAYVETYWVRQVLDGDDRHTRRWQALFAPELSPKASRGGRLPALAELRRWCQARHAENLARLRAGGDHPLLCEQYLSRFLIQHHAQHLETMRMVRVARCLRQPDTGNAATAPSRPTPPSPARVRLPGGRYRIGSDDRHAYDNERPAQSLELAAVELSARPASNADYLAFMSAGGYTQRAHWSDAGWSWRRGLRHAQPYGWRHTRAGWRQATPDGWAPLAPSQPAQGLSQHEAAAYARWSGGRLPHEHEWEAAARQGLLEGVGEVWEWCANPFYPYPGFTAYPYEGYSLPWFDARHAVLRGGSRHGCQAIRRPSFRNFHTAGKRHLFAGVRPAYDA